MYDKTDAGLTPRPLQEVPKLKRACATNGKNMETAQEETNAVMITRGNPSVYATNRAVTKNHPPKAKEATKENKETSPVDAAAPLGQREAEDNRQIQGEVNQARVENHQAD